MYNGIGLLTARGSGTSGYVQSNRFNLRGGSQSAAMSRPADLSAPVGNANKQPNQDILEHARKRDIELKVAELEDKLDEEGVDPDTIEERTSALRKQLQAAFDASLQTARPATKSDKLSEESHDVAQRKQKQMAMLQNAFGLGDVKEGEAFDPEAMEARRVRERAERDEERAKREQDRKEKAERREKEEAERRARAEEDAKKVLEARRERQARADDARREAERRELEAREARLAEREKRLAEREGRDGGRRRARSRSASPRQPRKRLDTRASPVPHSTRAASGSPERWAPGEEPTPPREEARSGARAAPRGAAGRRHHDSADSASGSDSSSSDSDSSTSSSGSDSDSPPPRPRSKVTVAPVEAPPAKSSRRDRQASRSRSPQRRSAASSRRDDERRGGRGDDVPDRQRGSDSRRRRVSASPPPRRPVSPQPTDAKRGRREVASDVVEVQRPSRRRRASPSSSSSSSGSGSGSSSSSGSDSSSSSDSDSGSAGSRRPRHRR